MKNMKRWIIILAAFVIAVGASTRLGSFKLKASDGDGTAADLQIEEVYEEPVIEVELPPMEEELPEEDFVDEAPIEEELPVEEIIEEEPAEEIPAEEPAEEIIEQPAAEEESVPTEVAELIEEQPEADDTQVIEAVPEDAEEIAEEEIIPDIDDIQQIETDVTYYAPTYFHVTEGDSAQFSLTWATGTTFDMEAEWLLAGNEFVDAQLLSVERADNANIYTIIYEVTGLAPTTGTTLNLFCGDSFANTVSGTVAAAPVEETPAEEIPEEAAEEEIPAEEQPVEEAPVEEITEAPVEEEVPVQENVPEAPAEETVMIYQYLFDDDGNLMLDENGKPIAILVAADTEDEEEAIPEETAAEEDVPEEAAEEIPAEEIPAEEVPAEEESAPTYTYQHDENGQLVLDAAGNPIAIVPEGADLPAGFARDENGQLILDENGDPIPTAFVPNGSVLIDHETDEEVETRSISLYLTYPDGRQSGRLGDEVTLTCVPAGYDNVSYTLQWQSSKDGSSWDDIEGCVTDTMNVVITEDNYKNLWRCALNIAAAE